MATRIFHWSGERRFFAGMGLMVLLLVFAGFAPSFFLRGWMTPYVPLRPISALVVVHGIVFSAWLVLFVVQSGLIAGRQHRLHRRLGYASLALALAMVGLGLAVAIRLAAAGRAPPGIDPLTWIWFSLLDVVTFAGLFVAGFLHRRDPAVHKRLMLLATLVMLGAALSRLPIFPPDLLYGESATIAAFLLALPLVAWDIRSRGHVMTVTTIGLSVLAAEHVVRLLFWESDAAHAIAGWIVRTAA